MKDLAQITLSLLLLFFTDEDATGMYARIYTHIQPIITIKCKI